MNAPLHLCLSGNPACSGINPCDACHQVYVTSILPKAMVAGGFNGSQVQAQAFFQGYGVARREVLQLLARQVQPTLNGAAPPGEEPVKEQEQEQEWEEGTPQLTDDEVAQMAAPPPPDFAPEVEDEDPGMPDEDRAKEVANALLKGESLARKAPPPPTDSDEAGDSAKSAPRRSRGKKTGDTTASKE